jgi:hypothetical protein
MGDTFLSQPPEDAKRDYYISRQQILQLQRNISGRYHRALLLSSDTYNVTKAAEAKCVPPARITICITTFRRRIVNETCHPPTLKAASKSKSHIDSESRSQLAFLACACCSSVRQDQEPLQHSKRQHEVSAAGKSSLQAYIAFLMCSSSILHSTERKLVPSASTVTQNWPYTPRPRPLEPGGTKYDLGGRAALWEIEMRKYSEGSNNREGITARTVTSTTVVPSR